MKVKFLCIYICLFFSGVLFAQTNTLVNDVNSLKKLGVSGIECSLVSSRLARLSCFDDVFETKFEVAKQAELKLPITARAISSEADRSDSLAFKLTYGSTPELSESAWVTSSAIPNLDLIASRSNTSSKPITPILMLSCLETISRVELILPEKIQDARVQISIFGDEKNTQTWISDESGFVLRTGRGVPAIKAMRAIISSRSLVLRSNSPVIDGLRFDSLNLASTMKPIREKCDW